MKNFAEKPIYQEFHEGGWGGYQPVVLSEAEIHINDLKDNLTQHRERKIKLWHFKEIIENSKTIRELKSAIANHRTQFPEYYL